MAIQLNMLTTNVGAPAPTAYARIAALSFDTATGEVKVAVNVYYTAAAAAAKSSPVSGGVYTGTVGKDIPSLDQTIPGVRAALYAWLMTLPDFAGGLAV